MSVISESSNQNDYFNKFSLLSEMEQERYINQEASTDEIVDLFNHFSKNAEHYDKNKIESIKDITLKKIEVLIKKYESMNAEQIEVIANICQNALQSEDRFKTTYIKIFSETIDSSNYLERIGFALENKNHALLNRFLKYVNTCVRIRTIRQGVIIKVLNVNNIDTFPLVGLFFKNYHSSQIFIEIDTETRRVSETQLLSFVETYGEQLHSLKLSEKMLERDSGLVMDELLAQIVAKCPNLEKLYLCDLSIKGTGLQNIPLCKKLKILQFIECPYLQVFPKFTIMSYLDITISFHLMTTDEERIKVFLAVFKKNPIRAVILFPSFEIKDKTYVANAIKRKKIELLLCHRNKFYQPNSPELVVHLNELVANDPEKAVKWVYALSNVVPPPIDDMARFILAVENHCLPHDPNKALRLAIDCDDVELARKAIDAGADVNCVNYLTTPLLRASKYSSSEMMDLLLANNADAKFLGGTHEHETPLSEARLRGHLTADTLALLTERDGGFTDEVFTIKLLAHKFSNEHMVSLKTIVDDKEFYLEGFRPRVVVSDYMNKSRSIYEELKSELNQGRIPVTLNNETQTLLRSMLEDRDKYEKFMGAIDTTISSIEYCLDYSKFDVRLYKDVLLSHLNDGKPVACFGVTNHQTKWRTGGAGLHAWGLVIIKDPASEMYQIYRCNRGSTDTPGITGSRFNEEQMLDVIEAYQDLTDWKSATKSVDDLRSLFTQLQPINQKMQQTGNCCYYSLQAIELALLICLFRPLFGENEAINLAKEIKRYRTNTMRFNDLKNYLELHFPGKSRYPVNWTLLKNIAHKTKDKPKLIRYYKLIIDFALQVASMQTDIPQSINDLINKYGTKAIESYARMRNAPSGEEQISAIIDLIKENTELLYDMFEYIPITQEEIHSLILRENPTQITKLLKMLGYSIKDALTFCMSHNIHLIDLQDYAINCNYFACQIINEVEGVENFKIKFEGETQTSIKYLSDAIAIGLSNTTSLDMHNLSNADVRTMQNLARYCPDLKELKITFCDNLDFKMISPHVSFPNLTHLSIQTSYNHNTINTESIQIFETCYPNLTSLTITNCPTIDFESIKTLARVCPKLNDLKLSFCRNVEFVIDPTFVGFPNLTTLDVAGCTNVDERSLSAIAIHCPNLSSLKK